MSKRRSHLRFLCHESQTDIALRKKHRGWLVELHGHGTARANVFGRTPSQHSDTREDERVSLFLVGRCIYPSSLYIVYTYNLAYMSDRPWLRDHSRHDELVCFCSLRLPRSLHFEHRRIGVDGWWLSLPVVCQTVFFNRCTFQLIRTRQIWNEFVFWIVPGNGSINFKIISPSIDCRHPRRGFQ